jgi:hypothetical protein
VSPTAESFFEVQIDALEAKVLEDALVDQALRLVHDIRIVLGRTLEIGRDRAMRDKYLSRETYELIAAIEAKGAELHAIIEEARNENRAG